MRKILHVDLDAFYASVEELDHPDLIGKPVIVGGKGERGVVSTCNYEARKYGVHSAMPGFIAKTKCPEGIFLNPNISRYQEVSDQVFSIILSITDEVQKVSIDEAYLEVTDLYQSPIYIAKFIKKKIKEEIGITLSVGVSYNKFLAKLASDWNKPDGIKVITKEMVPDILLPLPVERIHGIGRVSAKKLNSLGIFKVSDLMNYSINNLISFLGSSGEEVYYRIRGIDERSLKEEVKNKTYGTETTLKKNTRDREQLLEILREMMHEVYEIISNKNKVAKTIIIKVKYFDFQVITRSKSNQHYMFEVKNYMSVLEDLFDKIDFNKNVRLIGVTVSNIKEKENQQLSIFN
ncbi:MAG TPA: DNA polymerase IV [Clostridia bacterium]|nr:DNA polymerase IV [Clostridia bacterium]